MHHAPSRHRARTWLSAVAAGLVLASAPASALAADTTPPTILLATGPTTVQQGEPIELSVTASDASLVTSTQLQVDGGAWKSLSPPSRVAASTNRSAAAIVNAGAVQLRVGGEHFSCAVMVGRTVRCWGANDWGQLGNGSTNPSTLSLLVTGITTATQVATGGAHACALLGDGSVRCWGRGNHGQLGNGGTSGSSTPVAVAGLPANAVSIAAGNDHTCAVLVGGAVRCWGDNGFGQAGGTAFGDQPAPAAVSGIASATAVAAGTKHACALLGNRTIRCWGLNAEGQLGSESVGGPMPAAVTGISTATAIAAGTNHTCARLANSTVSCWGGGSKGQLGDGTTATRKAPKAVSGVSTATTVSAGNAMSCARLSSGSVRCWGNGYGTTQTAVAGITSAASVSVGGFHACARLSDQRIRCWGDNTAGALGYLDLSGMSSVPITVPGISAIDVGTGVTHSCAVLVDKTVRCWGANDWGKLGNGTSTPSATPVQAVGITTAIAVRAGDKFSCALLSTKSVKCWGSDAAYLESSVPIDISGVSGATRISIGYDHACAVIEGGTVRCWGSNDGGRLGDGTETDRQSGTPVFGLTGVLDVAAGAFHSCAALVVGSVKCWGNNRYGQLGDGTTTDRLTATTVPGIATAVAVSAGDFVSCAVLTAGDVKCWGDEDEGELGNGGSGSDISYSPTPVDGLTTASLVRSKVSYSCALRSGGTVACWGRNGYGQLGTGTFLAAASPVAVVGVTDATALAVGKQHTCAVVGAGVVKCWGDGRAGQIGPGVPTLPVSPPLDGVFGPLSAGSHQVCVRAGDILGNTSGSQCVGLTILDVTAPAMKVPTFKLRTGVQIAGGSLPITFAWSGTDNTGGSGIDHYEYTRRHSPDGGATVTVTKGTTTATSGSTTIPPDSDMTFAVRAFDKSGNAGTTATTPKINPLLAENTAVGVTKTGAWTTNTSTSYSGGSVLASSTAGSTVSYTFTGRAIGFVTTTSANRGKVDVLVDGIRVITVDTYSATGTARVLAWSKTFSSLGTHTITLKVLGTSGRPRVDLDAFAILITNEEPTTGGEPPTTGGGVPTQPATSESESPRPEAHAGLAGVLGLLLLSSLLILLRPRARDRTRS